MHSSNKFDVIIVGGSYTGLSAGISLVRSKRKVLIIDSGNPCNGHVEHAHNFIAHENDDPALIRNKGKMEFQAYPSAKLLEGLVTEVSKQGNLFAVRCQDQQNFLCDRLLFASGISDLMPGIAGFAECWGRSILHCPYCHGYEVSGKPMAVIANGEHAYHLCVLLSNLSQNLSLFTNQVSSLTEEQHSQISGKGIRIIDTHIKEIEHVNGQLRRIHFMDGSSEAFTAAFAKVQLRQQCTIPEQMGCKFNEHLIAVDECMRTSVEGVFAAGDNCQIPRSIAFACAAGVKAAFQINWDLSSQAFAGLGK